MRANTQPALPIPVVILLLLLGAVAVLMPNGDQFPRSGESVNAPAKPLAPAAPILADPEKQEWQVHQAHVWASSEAEAMTQCRRESERRGLTDHAKLKVKRLKGEFWLCTIQALVEVPGNDAQGSTD